MSARLETDCLPLPSRVLLVGMIVVAPLVGLNLINKGLHLLNRPSGKLVHLSNALTDLGTLLFAQSILVKQVATHPRCNRHQHHVPKLHNATPYLVS